MNQPTHEDDLTLDRDEESLKQPPEERDDEQDSFMEDETLDQFDGEDACRSVERAEKIGFIKKIVLILVIFCVFVLTGLYFFAPSNKEQINILQTSILGEIDLFESEPERLHFPSNKPEEIESFFVEQPDLGFQPKLLKPFHQDWLLAGATIIDYETQKVGVVAYQKAGSDEKIYYFMYTGRWQDIKNHQIGNFEGQLPYKTFSSENRNIIVWSLSSDTVALLVGRQESAKLAGFAYRGMGY